MTLQLLHFMSPIVRFKNLQKRVLVVNWEKLCTCMKDVLEGLQNYCHYFGVILVKELHKHSDYALVY